MDLKPRYATNMNDDKPFSNVLDNSDNSYKRIGLDDMRMDDYASNGAVYILVLAGIVYRSRRLIS